MEFYVLQADRTATERVITKYVDECERLAKNPPKYRLEESDPVEDPLQRKPIRPHIPASLRYEVMKRDRGKCQWCSRQAPDVVIHLDHIVPVSKGGETTLENLQLLCAEDNLAKSDRSNWKQ